MPVHEGDEVSFTKEKLSIETFSFHDRTPRAELKIFPVKIITSQQYSVISIQIEDNQLRGEVSRKSYCLFADVSMSIFNN